MKKIRFTFLAIVLSLSKVFSQDILVTLEYKTIPDSFYVYITPTFSDASFNMGTSQISVVFNSTFPVTNPPASSISVTGVNGGWTAQDFAQEVGGAQRKFSSFLTSGAALGNVNAGQRVLLFRYRVNGGNCVVGTTSRNFVNGTDPVDPASTFQDFTTFINVDGMDHLSSNSDVTMRACTQLILPVKIIEFNARRDGGNGIVNWSAVGEEFNSDYYELERSIDGHGFQSVTRIDCRKLTGLQKYEYVDQNITSLNSKYVYYRLKQYDFDDKFAVSGIRQLKMDISDKGVQMYPNPVKSGFYLNIPFTNPNQAKVSLTIMNGYGQAVHAKEITTQQATNYYYDLRSVQLAAGDYYLKIVQDGRVVDIKKFLFSKE